MKNKALIIGAAILAMLLAGLAGCGGCALFVPEGVASYSSSALHMLTD